MVRRDKMPIPECILCLMPYQAAATTMYYQPPHDSTPKLLQLSPGVSVLSSSLFPGYRKRVVGATAAFV